MGNTPVGDLWIAVSEYGLVAVDWAESRLDFHEYLTKRFKRPVEHNPKKASIALQQLDEYLRGERKAFSIPIDWSVLRPFQRQVLQITYTIPYGQTRTYGEIAEELGDKNKARAVGRAQATNPMPLVIPCHRVIGADDKLHGYGGGEGLPTKEWLLQMEGAVLA
ncbi:MAG: methylated-DNA--[protein]-cysteine S-methyltransferase [Anaerolineales bacterium]